MGFHFRHKGWVGGRVLRVSGIHPSYPSRLGSSPFQMVHFRFGPTPHAPGNLPNPRLKHFFRRYNVPVRPPLGAPSSGFQDIEKRNTLKSPTHAGINEGRIRVGWNPASNSDSELPLITLNTPKIPPAGRVRARLDFRVIRSLNTQRPLGHGGVRDACAQMFDQSSEASSLWSSGRKK